MAEKIFRKNLIIILRNKYVVTMKANVLWSLVYIFTEELLFSQERFMMSSSLCVFYRFISCKAYNFHINSISKRYHNGASLISSNIPTDI